MSELIGKPVSRLDGRLKVTGQAKYAGDYSEDRLAQAVIFESSIAKGSIQSFDLTEARKVRGLIDIITHENAPKMKKPKSQSGGGSLGEADVPLQDDEIRYNGQFIGVVVAETLEAAQQAARLIKVNYKQKTPDIDLVALKDKSKPLPKMEGMGKIDGERGNTKKALKNSAVTFQATYHTPIENHNPMEPSATLVYFKGDDLIVYDATQGVSTSADIIGQAAKAKNTQVISKFIGGGFGCKGSIWNHQFMAVLAAQKVKRPVKLVLTRQQMFTGVGHRAATIQDITLGCDAGGKFEAIEHVMTNNTSTDKEYSERSAVSTRMLYQCENLKAEHRIVKLNLQVPTFMRAPGEASGSAAMECALDELADKIKMDPIELRLKNYAQIDQETKLPYSSKSLKECYKRGAEKFGWGKRKPSPRAYKEGDEWVGYGMATATYPANRFGATASVELSDDGKIKVRCATQDIGTGSWTIFAQVPSDTFGVPLKNVDLDIGDSKFPKAGTSGGSSTASSVGSAIQKACNKIQSDLIKTAVADMQSPFYKLREGDVQFANGQLRSKSNPAQTQSFADVMKLAKKDKMIGEGEVKTERGKTETHSTHAFGAQFAEVRVHAITGQIRVTKLTGAFACGRILNEKTAHSQFMGGMVFGIGQCLMEETVPDLRSGRLVIKDLADYHVPVNADVPVLEVVMVEEMDEHVNVLGTKGIGEIGIVGLAAAIANAVYNAAGVRIRDFPLTPDKIIAAMGPYRV